jgi:hypothetical protein
VLGFVEGEEDIVVIEGKHTRTLEIGIDPTVGMGMHGEKQAPCDLAGIRKGFGSSGGHIGTIRQPQPE